MSKTALCIGINNYPGTHMDLQGCVNDAADWSQVLTARGFAVTTLLDATATKAAMVPAMSALIAGGVAGDSLVITFSGHGTYQPDADGDEADGLDEALCPHDIQTRGEALVDDEIRAIFAARKPGVRVLLIADSCHSGTVSRAAPAEPEADAPRPRFLPMGNWLPAARVTPVSVVPGARVGHELALDRVVGLDVEAPHHARELDHLDLVVDLDLAPALDDHVPVGQHVHDDGRDARVELAVLLDVGGAAEIVLRGRRQARQRRRPIERDGAHGAATASGTIAAIGQDIATRAPGAGSAASTSLGRSAHSVMPGITSTPNRLVAP